MPRSGGGRPLFDELEEKFRAASDRMEKPSRDGLDSALAEPCDDERTLVLVAVRRMHDIVRLAEAGAPEAQAVLMLLSSSLSLAALGAGGWWYRIGDARSTRSGSAATELRRS